MMNKEIKSKIRQAKNLTALSGFILPPSFWRHPIRWIRHKLWQMRLREQAKELNLEIQFESNQVATAKTVPHDWYKWN